MSDLSPIQTYDEAMAEAVALGLMTAGGTATDRCQCPTCGRVFSTDPNFMRHLNPDRYRAGFDKSLNCSIPQAWAWSPRPSHQGFSSGTDRARTPP